MGIKIIMQPFKQFRDKFLNAMKKILIMLIALIPFVTNCKRDSSSDPLLQIREVAWNSLSKNEKSTVNIDWKKANVELSTYNLKDAYIVVFNTEDEALLGPITVYVDFSEKTVLGQNSRD
jgi:hypothetical protein